MLLVDSSFFSDAPRQALLAMILATIWILATVGDP
jgi:hypothetical protein